MTKLNGCKSALAVFLVWAATAVASPEKTIFRELADFDQSNGSFPYRMSLVQGTDGSLYGTTLGGGFNNYGTVFKIGAEGKLTTLYSFCAQPTCTDSAYPLAGLVQGTNGNFYGTTYGEGGGQCNTDSCGTLFKITPGGKLTTLHMFNGTDGYWPFAVLIQATDGNFYGATVFGGAYHCGTVFKITPQGKLTTLHNFRGNNCMGPTGGLVQAADGNFYGTTNGLGAAGEGTVFKITPRGKLTTLYSFCAQKNCADGGSPVAGLIQGTDGNFYGTTSGAGFSCDGPGCGTVFKITPGGKLTTLHRFGATEGLPYAGLIQATDGDFYGTTFYGGYEPMTGHCARYGCGTVFKITAAGKFTTLHSFKVADGSYPMGGVIQATSGTFYGTTFFGGELFCKNAHVGCGTVFSLSTGLGPFVAFVRNSGKVGATVEILGQGFNGTTGVSFNGTAATFSVKSDTYLTATVPSGVATGFVTVSTPSGPLKSNVPFRVFP